jgi:hypothetical protein
LQQRADPDQPAHRAGLLAFIKNDRVIDLIAGFAIVSLGFAIRLFHLGAMGLEFDEAFSVQAGFRDLAGILSLLATSEPHPPFFYAFVHFWYPIAGTTEFALRFPELAASVLTIAVLIRVASMLGWRAGGLVGATLLAINPYQVWYAQEVRMYAPVALFGLIAVFFALTSLRRGRWRDLAGYAGCMSLALATHYYAAFLFLFASSLVAVAIHLRLSEALSLRRWLAGQVIVAAGFIAWLLYALRVTLHYIRAVPDPATLIDVIRDSLIKYSLGTSIPHDLGARFALVFLAVLLIGFGSIRREPNWPPRWFRALFLAGYLLLPLSLGFIVSLFRSMYAPNYFMVSAPAFYLALGLGIVGLFRVARPVGVLTFLVVASLELVPLRSYFFDPQYNKAELADAITYVERSISPGDGIVLDGAGQAAQFWYYHTVRPSSNAPWYAVPSSGADSSQPVSAQIDAIMGKQRGVWFLDYGVLESDRQHVVERYLSEHYYQAIYQPIYRNRVAYYAAQPEVPVSLNSLNLDCDGALQLLDFQSYAGTARPGDVLPVAVRLRAEGSARADYVVSWRLQDAAGHTVVQRDAEPANGFAPTSTWRPNEIQTDHIGIVVPDFLLPGRYGLSAVIYQKNKGIACHWQKSGAAVASSLVNLGQVEVTAEAPAVRGASVVPTHPAATSGGDLRFLGYDVDPGPYRPGEVLTTRLYWQVNRGVLTDDFVQARLAGTSGEVLWSSQIPLGPSSYLTSKWQPGRTIATYVDVPIPARASTGTDQLSFQLVAPGLQTSAAPQSEAVQVVARSRTFSSPVVPHPLSDDFGGEIHLLGYALSPDTQGEATPEEKLDLTLFWQDERVLNASYKVFTHLVGPDGKIYGQQDSIPDNGLAPTDSWLPGEVIADHYNLDVPSGIPPGDYQIVVGFYDATEGSRIPLASQGGDSAVVVNLSIKRGV